MPPSPRSRSRSWNTALLSVAWAIPAAVRGALCAGACTGAKLRTETTPISHLANVISPHTRVAVPRLSVASMPLSPRLNRAQT
eukprot:801083-Heterocapsa_arctica.AAC.1